MEALAAEKKLQLQLIKEWISYHNAKPSLSQLQGTETDVLQKRGSKQPSLWQARHFILQGNFLFYYSKSDDSTVFKGVVLLKDSTITAVKSFENVSNVIIIQPRYPNFLLNSSQDDFHTRHLQKKYYISFPTKSGMERWHKAIERSRKALSIVDPSAALPGVSTDHGAEARLLRTPSIQDMVSKYPIAAVSFGSHAITDHNDIAADRVLKKLQKLEQLALEFGPLV